MFRIRRRLSFKRLAPVSNCAFLGNFHSISNINGAVFSVVKRKMHMFEDFHADSPKYKQLLDKSNDENIRYLLSTYLTLNNEQRYQFYERLCEKECFSTALALLKNDVENEILIGSRIFNLMLEFALPSSMIKVNSIFLLMHMESRLNFKDYNVEDLDKDLTNLYESITFSSNIKLEIKLALEEKRKKKNLKSVKKNKPNKIGYSESSFQLMVDYIQSLPKNPAKITSFEKHKILKYVPSLMIWLRKANSFRFRPSTDFIMSLGELGIFCNYFQINKEAAIYAFDIGKITKREERALNVGQVLNCWSLENQNIGNKNKNNSFDNLSTDETSTASDFNPNFLIKYKKKSKYQLEMKEQNFELQDEVIIDKNSVLFIPDTSIMVSSDGKQVIRVDHSNNDEQSILPTSDQMRTLIHQAVISGDRNNHQFEMYRILRSAIVRCIQPLPETTHLALDSLIKSKHYNEVVHIFHLLGEKNMDRDVSIARFLVEALCEQKEANSVLQSINAWNAVQKMEKNTEKQTKLYDDMLWRRYQIRYLNSILNIIGKINHSGRQPLSSHEALEAFIDVSEVILSNTSALADGSEKRLLNGYISALETFNSQTSLEQTSVLLAKISNFPNADKVKEKFLS